VPIRFRGADSINCVWDKTFLLLQYQGKSPMLPEYEDSTIGEGKGSDFEDGVCKPSRLQASIIFRTSNKPDLTCGTASTLLIN